VRFMRPPFAAELSRSRPISRVLVLRRPACAVSYRASISRRREAVRHTPRSPDGLLTARVWTPSYRQAVVSRTTCGLVLVASRAASCQSPTEAQTSMSARRASSSSRASRKTDGPRRGGSGSASPWVGLDSTRPTEEVVMRLAAAPGHTPRGTGAPTAIRSSRTVEVPPRRGRRGA